MNLQAPEPGGEKSSSEMPLLSAPGPGPAAQASGASSSVSLWLPPPEAARPAPGVLSRGCGVASCPVASPCRVARRSLRVSDLAIGLSLETEESAATVVAPSLATEPTCPLKLPLALPASFLLVRPWPLGSLFLSARWKMEGTAVGLRRRCWSSSLREKLSLVKCSLQRNEYLVGVQFSLCTAFNHWIKRLESFRGNLPEKIHRDQHKQLLMALLSD